MSSKSATDRERIDAMEFLLTGPARDKLHAAVTLAGPEAASVLEHAALPIHDDDIDSLALVSAHHAAKLLAHVYPFAA